VPILESPGNPCFLHTDRSPAKLGIGARLRDHVVSTALEQPHAVKLVAVGGQDDLSVAAAHSVRAPRRANPASEGLAVDVGEDQVRCGRAQSLGLGFLGVRMDDALEADAVPDAAVAARQSAVRILVITAREDAARQVQAVLGGGVCGGERSAGVQRAGLAKRAARRRIWR
jgi:hypothetical protein